MVSSYVFDSFALLKLFQKEKGYQEVLRLLKTTSARGFRRYLHIMNFAEIIYIVKKRFGPAEKSRVIAAIHDLDLIIVPATDSIVYQAAELKGDYPLAFGDCFTLATALNYKAILVTGDPEFRRVERLVKIRWI